MKDESDGTRERKVRVSVTGRKRRDERHGGRDGKSERQREKQQKRKSEQVSTFVFRCELSESKGEGNGVKDTRVRFGEKKKRTRERRLADGKKRGETGKRAAGERERERRVS